MLLAGLALLLLLPFMLAIALWVWCDRSGSVLYTETRVGRGGRPFSIHKFRTLRAGSAVEPSVVVPGDPRVTRPGRRLRRWRLDELPQLVDVLTGAMSLVGPRPQTSANMQALDERSRQRLLAVRPGLTSPATLAHLGEDEVLADVDDAATCYRTVLVPAKARLDLAYLDRWTLWRDLGVLLQTLLRLFSGAARRRSCAHVRALLARCSKSAS